MPIELHCPKCQKMIRAPDTAGGHHGKCPYCGHSVYVPMPSTGEDDIIPIAPVDEMEERRAEEERREALRYAAVVDKATEGAAPEPPAKGKPAAGTRPSAPRGADTPGVVVELKTEVEHFVLAMKDSKLDLADAVAQRLRKGGDRARDYVEGLILDEIPPQIGNVPPALVQGFLKNLLSRLS